MLTTVLSVGVLVCAGSTGPSATSGNLDVFFSQSDAIQSMERQAPEITVDLSSGAANERLYIWANIDLYEYRHWNGLGLGFETDGAVTVTGGGIYNPNMGDDAGTGDWTAHKRFRWSNGAAGGSEPLIEIPMTADGYLNASAVAGSYVWALGHVPAQGDIAANPGDTKSFSDELAGGAWRGSYLLGYIDVEIASVESAVNFVISPAWTTRAGDTGSPFGSVAFGLNVPVGGRDTGAGGFANGRLNDVTFTPEPASLLLLALGVLGARRR